MTWKELRFLVLMWIGLAVLAAATMGALPVALVFHPIVYLYASVLTLFVYYSVFLPLYLLLRLIFWPFPPGRWRQWTADAVALAATIALAVAIPRHFNPIVRAKAAALQAGEMSAPINLAPVRSVALLKLDGNPVYDNAPSPESLKVCNEFCTALLVSGYAKEVIIGFESSHTGKIDAKMTGEGYALNGKRPDCIFEDKDWNGWYAGKPRSQAGQIGGFGPAFVARYASCISPAGKVPIMAADLVFLDYFPNTPSDFAFWRVNYDLEHLAVRDAQTVFESRNGKVITRITRSDLDAATLDTPMRFGISGGTAEWSKTTVAGCAPAPFLDGWWGMISNGEDIYAEALARDHVAINPEPRALSRRRKMK
jgi:hypothetical protein